MYFNSIPTDDPTRLAYQKRLKVWHTEGYTIGRGETVRELWARLPMAMKSNEDLLLTQAYEQVRYGQARAETRAKTTDDKQD